MTIIEAGKNSVIATDKHQQMHTIEADTIVMALGLRPRTTAVNELHTLAPEVYLIGDCVKSSFEI